MAEQALLIGTFLAIFIPLSISAWREHQRLRDAGLIQKRPKPTRNQIIAFAVFLTVLWGITLWYIIGTAQFIFPLIPIIGTIALIYQIRSYRNDNRKAA
ncbi:hypothetical protein [Arthrobacter pigmenti]|uniref:hypothetical protein n=1 Tax=Arthrobacter pigmenti TaxID=271432 RepID=UPI001ADCC989|nr:hypothetical protein [Arthrobacter pigmenti]